MTTTSTSSVDEILAAHQAAGRRFTAAGVGSFVLDEGPGGAEPVVCMHGVPASAFLYRKVVRELAARGLRGLAFDLPGLGLAERPVDHDYSWTGLGRFSCAAIEALSLPRFHLVVHDIGGPVGFEVAAAMPERVLSLTVLNTLIRADRFSRPWMMEPFAWRGLDRAWLMSARGPIFRGLMRYTGIADAASISEAELEAYIRLLHGPDRGRAFLRIMKGFELTAEKGRLYESVVQSSRYPVQIVWGERDRALGVDSYGALARQLAPGAPFHRLPGKHFLQEDCAPQIAELVAALAARAAQARSA
jgi:pimeloyl-ACP methyl ester carboxylesterase